MSKNPILQVSLPIPVNTLFDYEWKINSRPPEIGTRVVVNAKNRSYTGVVLGYSEHSNIKSIKPIKDIIDQKPIISNEIITLCKWASNYYHQPIGTVILSVLPQLLRTGKIAQRSKEITYKICDKKNCHHEALLKGKKQKYFFDLLIEHGELSKSQIRHHKISNSTIQRLLELKLIIEEEKDILYSNTIEPIEKPYVLNDEQQRAFDLIKKDLDTFRPYLLYGVTGSGKTEIYMHIIQEVLEQDKQVLVLVPEIGLTPQTLQRFTRRFHVNIGVMHSNLTEKQKLDTWLDAKNGRARIVIGTRSSLFIPMQELGLIIVDEEHDSSYKQTERFRYHARDLSMIRAKNLQIPIILGSATPSLGTMYNALNQKYKLLTLSNRANSALLPSFRIIDMQKCFDDLSKEIITNIRSHLNNQSQVLLFLNRRGFAPIMLCPNCGWSAKCHHCDTNFTYHKMNNILLCHLCENKQSLPEHCQNCRLTTLKPVGIGTEKLAELLHEEFPQIEIVRIDQDTTRKKGSLDSYLDKINSNKPMILVGTQILSKGHHFPNVSMVGILGVDNGLYSSDFHAIEKLGQTITQVSGRAGRENKHGKVFIQTYNPNHIMLDSIIQNNYLHFIEQLLEERKQALLPPFSSHALFVAQSDNSNKTIRLLKMIKKAIQDNIKYDTKVLGPFPAIKEKVQGKYRSNLLIQSPTKRDLQEVLSRSMPAIANIRYDYKTRWLVDIDPIDLI